MSHHQVLPEGSRHPVAANFVLNAFGNRRSSARRRAPTRRPFFVRHAGVVTMAEKKNVHVAGVPADLAVSRRAK